MGQVHPESPACHLEVPEDRLVRKRIQITDVMINNPEKETGNYRH